MAEVMSSCDSHSEHAENGIEPHPSTALLALAAKLGREVENLEFAQYMDQHDPLRHLRDEFFYPKMKDLVTSRVI